MGEDTWAGLADRFADEAYASVKGYVRTYVLHHQLLEHLPEPPAPVLDVGGGAGHQSFPLAQAGYEVTVLDPSPAMLAKARGRLERLPADARQRVTLVHADGEHAEAAVDGRRFAAVLCHGVLGYLEQPEPVIEQLCRCAPAAATPTANSAASSTSSPASSEPTPVQGRVRGCGGRGLRFGRLGGFRRPRRRWQAGGPAGRPVRRS